MQLESSKRRHRMSDQRYRVCTRNRSMGWEGKGPAISQQSAESQASAGNEHHPQIEHWIEPVGAESDLERARR
jgi:hypothetical protein